LRQRLSRVALQGEGTAGLTLNRVTLGMDVDRKVACNTSPLR
jgi:hypothetical protein